MSRRINLQKPYKKKGKKNGKIDYLGLDQLDPVSAEIEIEKRQTKAEFRRRKFIRRRWLMGTTSLVGYKKKKRSQRKRNKIRWLNHLSEWFIMKSKSTIVNFVFDENLGGYTGRLFTITSPLDYNSLYLSKLKVSGCGHIQLKGNLSGRYRYFLSALILTYLENDTTKMIPIGVKTGQIESDGTLKTIRSRDMIQWMLKSKPIYLTPNGKNYGVVSILFRFLDTRDFEMAVKSNSRNISLDLKNAIKNQQPFLIRPYLASHLPSESVTKIEYTPSMKETPEMSIPTSKTNKKKRKLSEALESLENTEEQGSSSENPVIRNVKMRQTLEREAREETADFSNELSILTSYYAKLVHRLK